MRVELWNSVYENNWNISIQEHDTLTHFKPMLHFNTPWKYQKTGGISIVEIDPKKLNLELNAC